MKINREWHYINSLETAYIFVSDMASLNKDGYYAHLFKKIKSRNRRLPSVMKFESFVTAFIKNKDKHVLTFMDAFYMAFGYDIAYDAYYKDWLERGQYGR